MYEKIRLLILYNMVWFYLLNLILLKNLVEYLVRESALWSSLALSPAGAGLTL